MFLNCVPTHHKKCGPVACLQFQFCKPGPHCFPKWTVFFPSAHSLAPGIRVQLGCESFAVCFSVAGCGSPLDPVLAR